MTDSNAVSSRELIATLTISGSPQTSLYSTTCFTNTGGSPYNYYEIVLLGVQPTANNGSLGVQFYSSSKNLLVDAGYNTMGCSNDVGGNSFFSFTGTFLPLNDFQHRDGAQANSGVFGTIQVYDPGSENMNKTLNSRYYCPEAHVNQGCIVMTGGSYLTNTNPITGISFSFYDSSGNQTINIAGGTILIYGYTDPASS